jgi:hypothetical protein
VLSGPRGGGVGSAGRGAWPESPADGDADGRDRSRSFCRIIVGYDSQS